MPQALIVNSFNTSPTVQEIEPTKPDAREVQLRVIACSLNFADTLMIQGKYQETPDLPFSPGLEVVGDVIASQDASLSPGDRVLAMTGHGGLGEIVNVPATKCFKVSGDLDPVILAALPIAYGTSEMALHHRARLLPGENLLVLGAAGGVGLTAVELGAAMGANVIACARGEDKLRRAREKGAHHLIDSDKHDIRGRVLELGGADVVYDPVGGDQFKAALRACNPEARLLPLGFASGDIPQIPANIIMVKNLSVIGFYFGGYLNFAPELLRDSVTRLIDLYTHGKIDPHVSHILPLAQANDGLDLLRERKSTGKVVIDMRL